VFQTGDHASGAYPTNRPQAPAPGLVRAPEYTAAVALPDHVKRFWRALDDLLADVHPTRWGAVVTDGRYPAIWDANYARVDSPVDHLTVSEIEAELLPALRAVGATVVHTVSFAPEATTGLLVELSQRGHRLSWDLVMDLDAAHPPDDRIVVEELPAQEELWERVEAAMPVFGVESAEAVVQLRALEEHVLVPGGKRWFGVRDDAGTIVTLAALLTLEGVGYVDNVVTFPQSRGRGYASAVTSRIVREALAGGADHVCLFTDPDDQRVVRLYERLGFRAVGRLAATRGPLQTE
jgi:ribosomal protein S18 acetylase RimI-like enzyme